MFYDKFVELCKAKGVKPTVAAVEMGLSKATPSKWKRTEATPQTETLTLVANYFGVSVNSLIEVEDSNSLDDMLDGFTYAAHSYSGKLTDDDKAVVMKMMATLAAANNGGNDGETSGGVQ